MKKKNDSIVKKDTGSMKGLPAGAKALYESGVNLHKAINMSQVKSKKK